MAKNTPALSHDTRFCLKEAAESAAHIQKLVLTIQGILDLVKSGSECGYESDEAQHEHLLHGYYMAKQALEHVDGEACIVLREMAQLDVRPAPADMDGAQ